MYTYVKAEPNGKIASLVLSDLPITTLLDHEEVIDAELDKGKLYYYENGIFVELPPKPAYPPDYVFNYDTKLWESVATPAIKLSELETIYKSKSENITFRRHEFTNTEELRGLLLAYILSDDDVLIYDIHNNPVEYNVNAAKNLVKRIMNANYFNKRNYLALLAKIKAAKTQAEIDAIDINEGWWSE
jgi:hypothetical protein